MKQPTDFKTIDMLGVPARRGRPRKHADNAAKQAAYRESNDLVTLTVDIPRELAEGFEEYLKFKDMKKNQVIAKLLRSQLLRKR
jgi:hypothetical protein